MIQWCTAIARPNYPFELNYSTKIWTLGSCFSDHIGRQLFDAKFQVTPNPFGVLFNPKSIFILLDRVLSRRYYEPSDWILMGDRYVNLELHSDHSYPSPKAGCDAVNTLIDQLFEDLQRLDVLFLTFGTAWFYRYNSSGDAVANCHKIPQREFSKTLLTSDEIANEGKRLLCAIRAINPNLKVVLTVSPVRHLKDGAIENQWSKSLLFVAIHQWRTQMEAVYYFPAYELLMDELRDYRFYADDLVHPSAAAINAVWSMFKESLLDEDTRNLQARVGKLKLALKHRPFNPEGKQHQQFLRKTLAQLETLSTCLDHADFTSERQQLVAVIKAKQ